MKILALGGCGEMGGYAVRTLLKNDSPPEIIIADKNAETAENFAKNLGNMVRWMSLDISDQHALSRAVGESDLVMNTVGPYFKFGKSVLTACIQAQKHYVDICDDWEPTLEMLALHPEAEKAGITAIVGMGASPGISNMLAVKAMGELDHARKIYTGWDLDSAKPEKTGKKPSAATVHGVHQLTGTIRAFENGEYIYKKPIRRLTMDYPGIGPGTVWTIGHPEAVTLPRYFQDLTLSSNVMTTSPGNIFGLKIVAMLVDGGIISVDRAAWVAEKVGGPANPQDTPEKMLSEMVAVKRKGLPPLFALAVGEKDGKLASAACMITSAPAGGMGGATGVPLAVAAMLLGKGAVLAKGVFAPEAAISPEVFFNTLGPLCAPARNGAQDLVLTTRSWELVQVRNLLRKFF
ncbi:MAG: saccharopine dehydrogenase NADP-binding domain-containing protein [Proteobacteria bacterium]|nr:saccharopine dehydrogenase NADP-binding domain-containing protein [Pseudomonadota bacterium]